MSGHSKWSSIKHKKALTDMRRGKLFSKISRMITVAAREKGKDPEINPALRLAIEKAKQVNMPTDNIERAIKRGTGEGLEGQLENIKYEAYGPAGIAFIIEAITDNKNRTTSEIKHILSSHDSRLAEPGSIEWMFEKRGVIEIIPENLGQKANLTSSWQADIELKAIDAGAIDVDAHGETIDIYTNSDELDIVKQNLEKAGLKIGSLSLDYIAKNPISVSEDDYKKIEALFDALDEHNDVQEIYSNIKT